MAGPSATSSAALIPPNPSHQPVHRRAGSVSASKSDAFFSSTSTMQLPLPPQAISRRASDSCLPPPCASTLSLVSATSTLIPRISAPSATPASTTSDRPATSTSGTKKRRSSLTGSSREDCTKSSGPASLGSIEKRLEEAIQHLSDKQAQQAKENSQQQDDDEDDEDMYNDTPSSSSCYATPFLPQFPLEPLELLFTPRHRSIDIIAVKRALRQSKNTVSTSSRRVSFASSIVVVDVFAAADYPGRYVDVNYSECVETSRKVFAICRRGPPPVEKLSMRDILELREVKIELGTYQPLSDSIQSTSFSKVSNIESGSVTSPTSPTVSHFSDISIEDDDAEQGYDEGDPASDEYSSSPPHMSGPGSQDSSSLPSSVEISLSSSASSLESSPSTAPTTASSSYSVSYTHRQYVNPTIKSLREQSPDSLSATTGSALSSPALSISGSPSASESDFAIFDEEDDDLQPIKLVITPETPCEEKSSMDVEGKEVEGGGNKTPTQASRFAMPDYNIHPSSAKPDEGYFKIPVNRNDAAKLATPTPTSLLQSRRVSDPALPFSSRKGSASSGKMNLFDTPIAPLSGPWGLGR